MDITLILSKIFSFMNLNERLRMRLVCKAWYDFVSYLEQRGELCIYEKKVPHKLKWSTDGAEVRWTVKIETSKLDLSKDPFLKGLKRFYVYVIWFAGTAKQPDKPRETRL